MRCGERSCCLSRCLKELSEGALMMEVGSACVYVTYKEMRPETKLRNRIIIIIIIYLFLIFV